MRTRTAKKLAQRIDLNYFKHPHGMRRWRGVLSLAIPAAALLWLGTLAVAGDRTVYSSGPVSNAHAFVEAKCEVCHTPEASFRSHVTEQGCLTCHDAPAHVQGPFANGPYTDHVTPDCATCHREHQGRVQLAATADKFCIDCHGDLTPGAALSPASPLPPVGTRVPPPPPHLAPPSPGPMAVARRVGAFPADHAEFAVLRTGYKDPGNLRFNHEVHNSPMLRGPNGTEKLECTTCHRPEISRVSSQRRMSTGLMASINYEQQCARCHTLFFDERIDLEVPHEEFRQLKPLVTKALSDFIRANPGAMMQPEVPGRRIPLNFPREPEPLARTPEEWVTRRAARAERLLSERTCAYCHGPSFHTDGSNYSGPQFLPTNLHTQWMPRARFDHAPHLMVQCASCHTGAETSRDTADVLMPSVATCATCHAPSKGASSQCVECHGYHDWTKAQPVKPHFKLTDFK
jgi:predicted CXXCH cytochrome family protein